MFIMQLFVGEGRIDRDGFAQVTGMSRGKKGRDSSLSCENLIHKTCKQKTLSPGGLIFDGFNMSG